MKTGMGRRIIMISEEILKTAFVIMWFVSAEQFTVKEKHVSSQIMSLSLRASDSRSGGGTAQ
jgi:hypothetical protein